MKIYQAIPKDDFHKYEYKFELMNSEGVTPYSYTPGLGTEYELFKEIYETTRPSEPWGLVSSKFEIKCPIKLIDFINFATNKLATGSDCVFINPMLINESLFFNVWEQGQLGHKGMAIIQKFLIEENYIFNNAMGVNSFAFCNYFVGNNFFWEKYFQYVDEILDRLHTEASLGTDVGAIFAGNANYHKNPTMSMQPFIVERLFSSFINKHKDIINFSHYQYEIGHYEKKCGYHYGQMLYKLSRMKNSNIKNASGLHSWNTIRNRIAASTAVFMGLLHLDDPDEKIISSIDN